MKDQPSPPAPQRFETTHWSLVAAAQPDEVSLTRAREALEELCRAYWYPLYAFVRSRGYSAADAQDLTQAFFARIIETGGLASADRERGRFRSYLLGAMKHFLANEWHRGQTQKRGGQVRFVEWDALEPATPERRTSRGQMIRNTFSIANGRWKPLPGLCNHCVTRWQKPARANSLRRSEAASPGKTTCPARKSRHDWT